MAAKHAWKDHSVGIIFTFFQVCSLYFAAASCIAGWMWTHFDHERRNCGGGQPVRSPVYGLLYHTSA